MTFRLFFIRKSIIKKTHQEILKKYTAIHFGSFSSMHLNMKNQKLVLHNRKSYTPMKQYLSPLHQYAQHLVYRYDIHR